MGEDYRCRFDGLKAMEAEKSNLIQVSQGHIVKP